jgi:transcriptional regulator with XRE-family HTH domain
MSVTCSPPRMPSRGFDATVRRRLDTLNRDLGAEVRQLREDAGLTRLAVARAAGVSDAFLGRIEDGGEHPSSETLIRIGLVLGADLRVRLYPNSGPAIRDRHQAPMLEHLLRACHPRWQRYAEVAVRRPARGWIDVVLHEPREQVAIATELQSELRRLEQLVRWHGLKADALRSWDGWTHLGAEPSISRLLVVRRTRATRAIASGLAAQLRLAFPAHPDDAVAALTGTQPWPGPALVWVALDGPGPRFVSGR